jgi:hypothetical protein
MKDDEKCGSGQTVRASSLPSTGVVKVDTFVKKGK